MLTKGQIETFVIIAYCTWACNMACLSDLLRQCDKMFYQREVELEIVNAQLEAIDGFDPDATDSCLTYEQIYDMIQNIMKSLGMCTDIYQLNDPYK